MVTLHVKASTINLSRKKPPRVYYIFLCIFATYSTRISAARRSLAIVYEEDVEEYDLAMVDVCAAVVGVEKERVVSVWTDFGPEGPTINDSARRGLQTTR